VTVVFHAAAVSDIGPHRAVNQDAAFTAPWGAAVADGVGGGPAGDIASSTLLHRFVAGARGALEVDQLATLLRVANWDLRAQVERDPLLEGMATTFTGLFAGTAGNVLLAHTGDSRAYLLREGALSRETRDDSFVQLLIDNGVVQQADAAFHPHRHVITASLRGGDDDRIALAEREARLGDRWLLCSDGVTDYVGESDLHDLLATGDAETAAFRIVERALSAGSRDNVTAVVCDIVAEARSSASPIFAGSAATRYSEAFDDLESA
jgi:protein phosphatase